MKKFKLLVFSVFVSINLTAQIYADKPHVQDFADKFELEDTSSVTHGMSMNIISGDEPEVKNKTEGKQGHDKSPGEITLVKDGVPFSVIIISETPAPSAAKAAKELQVWLEKMSGALVPVKTENQISKSDNDFFIFIGDTKKSRKSGINTDKFEKEEIVIKTTKNGLIIAGDDELPNGRKLNGTVFAVNIFAEKILGIKKLWPGELGEVVPHKKTIQIGDIDIRQKPVLIDRQMVNLSYNPWIYTKIDALGWNRNIYKNYFSDEENKWLQFHKIGGSYNGSFGHAFGDYWDRFHEDHPDWFALQPDGTRDNSQPEHAKYPGHRLCVSNRGLIEQVAKDVMKKLEEHPELDAVSISPNDGGKQTFCLCPHCEAWDAPSGDTIYMDSKNGPVPHVSLTDRYVRFYSEVAKIVEKTYPNRYLGAYAYHVYTEPPVKEKLHPNIIIGFVPEMRVYQNDDERDKMLAGWEGWSQSANHLFLRPNFLMALQAIPAVYVHRLAEDMRFFADNKMMFARFDCNYNHWATNGLNYYVLAGLMWNPYANVDEIINEYCAAGFGNAANEVHQYIDEIETLTTAIANERKRPDGPLIARYYSDENIAKLDKLLDAAYEKAEDKKVKK